MATPAPGKKFAKKVGNRTVSYGDARAVCLGRNLVGDKFYTV